MSGISGGLESGTESRRYPRMLARKPSNLTLLSVSIGIALLAGEGLVRILVPPPLPWLYPQIRFRELPGIGFGLVPGEVAYTADKKVRVNRNGLRGEPVTYERVPGDHRLLFLGDSIVFGYGVDEKDAVPSRLGDLLRETHVRTQVINAGVPAYGIDEELRYLEREGIRYRPDWVILGTCWNDINDNKGVKVSPDGWLVSIGGRDRLRQADSWETPFMYEVRNLVKRSRLAYAGLNGYRVLMESLLPDSHYLLRQGVLEGRETREISAGWERISLGIRRLKELSRRQGFKSLVVTFPLPPTVESSYPLSSYPARVRQAAEEEGILFLDLTESFRRNLRGHDSLFIPFDADHPNAAGHDLAARLIRDTLLQEGLGAGARQATD